MRPVTTAVVVVFVMVAFLHLARLIFQVEVIIGSMPVPMWVSAGGVLVPPIIAWALWSENRKSRQDRNT